MVVDYLHKLIYHCPRFIFKAKFQRQVFFNSTVIVIWHHIESKSDFEFLTLNIKISELK